MFAMADLGLLEVGLRGPQKSAITQLNHQDDGTVLHVSSALMPYVEPNAAPLFLC